MTALQDAITRALLHSVWQDALIAGTLATALVGLRWRSAQARYLACCAALAAMVLVPAATLIRSLHPSTPSITASFLIAPASGVTPPPYTPDTAARPFDETTRYGWETRLLEAVQPWALPAWLMGVLLFSVRTMVAGTCAFALTRRVAPADAVTLGIVQRLAASLRLTRRIRVHHASIDEGPATVGWLRPVLLLPPATALGVTRDQFEALVAHELAHIRRHDYLVNLLQLFVETIFFYHPAIWWASRLIRIERELCCDDIAVTIGGDAIDYARALTAVARIRMGMPPLAVAARGGAVLHRIQRLVQPPDRHLGTAWPGVLIIGLMVLAATTVRAGWRDQQHDTAPTSSSAVSGWVYDPFSEPAANITITLDNNVIDREQGPFGAPIVLETTSDASGFYRFDRVPSGRYMLTPNVDWARPTSFYAPPNGRAEQDVWIAFDTVNTSLYANKIPAPRPRSSPSADAAEDQSFQSVVGPRHLTMNILGYPEGLDVEGNVVLEGHIATDGSAHSLRVMSASDPALARAALAAAAQQRWSPARVRGTPVEVPVRITAAYRFNVN